MRQSIVYKEWAPDQPDLGAQNLITASGVLASISGYKPFHPLDTSLGTIGGVTDAAFVSSGRLKSDSRVYAHAGNTFYIGTGVFSARGVSTANVYGDTGSFTQFGDLIIFAGGAPPKKHTVGSSGDFSTLASSATAGTAPSGSVIGVLGEFVLIGNIFDAVTANMAQHAIQWCGIGNAESWPTPNSATAIAQQAGYQEMDRRYGRVTGIHGGDQHGVILQDTGVTRVTYVGPPVVFQFDSIANNVGSIYPNRSIQAGRWVYFLSLQGFCRTDGVTVELIGSGKVDEYFRSRNLGADIQIGYDYLNKNVMFAYSSVTPSAQSTLNSIFVFNEDTSGWTHCESNVRTLISPGGGFSPGSRTVMAFNATDGGTSILGKFQATAGAAVFETSDAEFNAGGRAFVDGIKPNVESSGTAPAMTVRIGYRDDLGTSPTYTSATSANSATGFADFRVDAKYHRAEITITGNFDRTTGFVASAQPSSQR